MPKNFQPDSVNILQSIERSQSPLLKAPCQILFQVITNLLETDYYRCKVGALKVLKGVAASPVIRRQVANMGGIELVTNVLTLEETHLNLLCTETLASLAKLKRARCLIRRHGGLPKLISLLDVDLASVSYQLRSRH